MCKLFVRVGRYVSSGVFAYGSHCSGSQQIEELKRYKYVSRCGKTSTSPLMGNPDLQQEHCWNWKGTKHGKELESRMGMTKLYLRSKVYTHEASKEPAFMYAMLMPTVHYYL